MSDLRCSPYSGGMNIVTAFLEAKNQMSLAPCSAAEAISEAPAPVSEAPQSKGESPAKTPSVSLVSPPSEAETLQAVEKNPLDFHFLDGFQSNDPGEMCEIESSEELQTPTPEQSLADWRAESKNIIEFGRSYGTEEQRRDAVARAMDTMIQEKVQYGKYNPDYGDPIECPQGPYVAYIKAGLISADQAKHLLGVNALGQAVPDPNNTTRLLLESMGIAVGQPIPQERLYKGPGSEPKPKAGDIAVFVEKDAQGNATTSASHFATFTGDGWKVMSVQRNPNPDAVAEDHPTVETTIEEIWAGDFNGTAVVICPFPFRDPQ